MEVSSLRQFITALNHDDLFSMLHRLSLDRQTMTVVAVFLYFMFYLLLNILIFYAGN